MRVVLRATNADRKALRVGNTATVITLLTSALVEPDNGSDAGPDALVIAQVQAGVDALVGVTSPHVPGGVFEGWCFVAKAG